MYHQVPAHVHPAGLDLAALRPFALPVVQTAAHVFRPEHAHAQWDGEDRTARPQTAQRGA